MLALGLLPKLAFIVASAPQCVLGGAGFIMFGMVAPTGNGVILTSIATVLLNAFFNRTSQEQAEVDVFLAAQAAEYI
jgi:uric acid transporter